MRIGGGSEPLTYIHKVIAGRPKQWKDSRTITIDPNALTADELWERFKIEVGYDYPGEAWSWWIDGGVKDGFDSESAARRAATDWLREQGKL